MDLHGLIDWCHRLGLVLSARVGRVGAVNDVRDGCYVHVPATFLTLYILVDVLDIRHH